MTTTGLGNKGRGGVAIAGILLVNVGLADIEDDGIELSTGGTAVQPASISTANRIGNFMQTSFLNNPASPAGYNIRLMNDEYTHWIAKKSSFFVEKIRIF
jgi:hypothetical protein